MMKSLKKLMLALSMFLLSIVLLSTASYAWFTANNQVSAQGFDLTASVPTNLLISDDGRAWDHEVTLSTEQKTEMTPVSSWRGYTDSFYVVTSPKSDHNGIYLPTDSIKAVAVGNTADGPTYYLDIPVYLKVEGEAEAQMQVGVAVEFVSGGTGGNEFAGAYRLSVFEGQPTNGESDTLLYFSSAVDDGAITYPVVGTEKISDTASAPYVAENSILVDTSGTRLTIRIWLEGQDSRCVNSKASGKVSFRLTFQEMTA